MLKWNVFLQDLARSFHAPKALYVDIHGGHRTPSWLCVALYCAIYVAYTSWAAFHGVTPPEQPLLKIELQRYYLVQSFYEAPLVFALWILASGLIQLLSKPFGGRGTFDATLVMTGYAIWAPWFLLIPLDIFRSSGLIYNLVLTVLILWTWLGTSISIRVEQGIGWLGALVSSLIAILSISLLLFVLIR